MDTISQLKQDLVSACRILSQKKLVEGFGHVSARIVDTEFFLLTPRIGLALIKESDLLTLNLRGEVVEGSRQPPSETSLHTAIMKAKPNVNASLSRAPFPTQMRSPAADGASSAGH